MNTKCVIDSSSIISLCKCGLEGYLADSGWKFVSIREVFTEVVARGLEKGFLEALIAKRLFDDGTIETIAPLAAGAGATDDKVIEAAAKTRSILLANDVKMRRRASLAGATAIGSADFCIFLLNARKIGVGDFKEALGKLVEQGRLSPKNAEKYLEGI